MRSIDNNLTARQTIEGYPDTILDHKTGTRGGSSDTWSAR
jgi:hypothetical protein